uniref:Uncharacterized protein n=1 Tax=Arundo donax TaxID=35708 RepID=A0A0A9BQH6_ARUDO
MIFLWENWVGDIKRSRF